MTTQHSCEEMIKELVKEFKNRGISFVLITEEIYEKDGKAMIDTKYCNNISNSYALGLLETSVIKLKKKLELEISHGLNATEFRVKSPYNQI